MPTLVPWLHHWNYQWQHHRIRDQKGLWITSFFRWMALTLVSIFSVIFVFEFGQSVIPATPIKAGLMFVLIYFLILEVTIMLAVIPMAKYVINEIGYRKSIILSLMLTILGYVFLILGDQLNQWIWVLMAPVALGVGGAAYWPTYHVLFVDDSKKDTLGSAFGTLEAFSRFGQVIAPLVGAAITVLFGYQWLFISGIMVLVISGLPMLFLRHHLHFDQVSFQEFFTWSKEKRFLRLGVAVGGRAIDERILAHLWPVYVFLLAGSIEAMGVFQSIVILASALFGLLIAKIFDKRSDKRIQVIGVLGGMTAWSVRLLAQSFGQILVIDSVDKFFTTGSRMFFFGYLFRRARGRQSLSFIVYITVWETFWLSCVYLSFLILLMWVDLSVFWLILSATAALGLLVTLLIQDHK